MQEDMIYITIKAIKDDVLQEVAKTTAYEGQKSTDDDAYDRMFTTEADCEMLERFWDEAASVITEMMKRFIVSVEDAAGGKDAYVANLEVGSRYDTSLTASVEKSLFSYFVNSIMGKWNSFVNGDSVARYEGEASKAMGDIGSKLLYKKKPRRTLNIEH